MFKNLINIFCEFKILGEKVLFDVDSHTKEEIVNRLIKTLGKTPELLETERRIEMETKAQKSEENPANFGEKYARFCMCSVPGQLPCSGLVPLPKHWRGKYHFGQNMEEE